MVFKPPSTIWLAFLLSAVGASKARERISKISCMQRSSGDASEDGGIDCANPMRPWLLGPKLKTPKLSLRLAN
jgi:hypothetical protein